ncbi:MAG: hypothetical protein RL215_556 [Planctomycetota bacterium]
MLVRGIGDPLCMPGVLRCEESRGVGVMRGIWMSAGPAAVVLAAIQLIDGGVAERRVWGVCYVLAVAVTAVARLAGWLMGDRRTLGGRPMPGLRLALTLCVFGVVSGLLLAAGTALSGYSGDLESVAAVD